MPEDDDDDGGFDAFAARMEAASELRARRDRLFARWHRLQLRLEDWHPLGRLVKLYAGDRLRFLTCRFAQVCSPKGRHRTHTE
jgi:hypothetical protein